MFTLIAIGAAAIFGLSVLGGTFYTVPQKHVGLITQFGRHSRTVSTPGLKVKIPFIQKVEELVPTALQTVEVELDTKTKDDLFVKLPIKIQFEVNNPAKFYFDNANPIQQVKDIISAETRKYTSGKEFQELYNEREEISDGVISAVKSQMDEYGIALRRIVIDEPRAPIDVQDAFNKVRASERLKDAAKNEAEADYIRRVRAAEADKDRDLLRGEGAAGYRERIFAQYAQQIESLTAHGTPREEAVAVMMAIMRLDTYREVGDKGNMIIVTPDNETGKAMADFQALSRTVVPANGNEVVQGKDQRNVAARGPKPGPA